MKWILILSLIFLAFNQPQPPLDGNWHWQLNTRVKYKYHEINFKNDTLYLIDDLYKDAFTYRIKDERIHAKRINDSFQLTIPFKQVSQDTIQLFDSLNYIFKDLHSNHSQKHFDLIDFQTGHFFEGLESYDAVINLELNDDDSLQLSSHNDKINFEKLPQYILHAKRIVFLVGANVSLKQLIPIYELAAHHGIGKILFIRSKTDLDSYHVTPDYVFKHTDLLPPVPGNKLTLDTTIFINSLSDIETLNNDKPALYVLDDSMKLGSYLAFLNKLKKLPKHPIQIRVSPFTK